MSECNRVKKIHDLGQSIWLDFFDREIMNTGKLKKLIGDNGISGITSNLIFLFITHILEERMKKANRMIKNLVN